MLGSGKYRHQNEFISKLRQLKCKNPKKHWDAINNELKSKNSQGPVPVSLNDLLEHFKTLTFSETETSSSAGNEPPGYKAEFNNAKLNDPINVGEVNKAIIKLQNNKACGMDQMINEFFKASSSLLATTLTRVFNLILDSGIIPPSWSIGIIKPLYKKRRQ